MPVTRLTLTTADGQPVELTGDDLTTDDVLAALELPRVDEDTTPVTPVDYHAPYRADDLIHWREDGPEFATRAVAVKHAQSLYEIDSESAYGIWDKDGECLAILYDGMLYTP